MAFVIVLRELPPELTGGPSLVLCSTPAFCLQKVLPFSLLFSLQILTMYKLVLLYKGDHKLPEDYYQCNLLLPEKARPEFRSDIYPV